MSKNSCMQVIGKACLPVLLFCSLSGGAQADHSSNTKVSTGEYWRGKVMVIKEDEYAHFLISTDSLYVSRAFYFKPFIELKHLPTGEGEAEVMYKYSDGILSIFHKQKNHRYIFKVRNSQTFEDMLKENIPYVGVNTGIALGSIPNLQIPIENFKQGAKVFSVIYPEWDKKK